jgi:hypothetical protein
MLAISSSPSGAMTIGSPKAHKARSHGLRIPAVSAFMLPSWTDRRHCRAGWDRGQRRTVHLSRPDSLIGFIRESSFSYHPDRELAARQGRPFHYRGFRRAQLRGSMVG